MPQQDLTAWFDPGTKPTRVGWYETQLVPPGWPTGTLATPTRWWWNGWRWQATAASRAAMLQDRYWRGLARDPKGYTPAYGVESEGGEA